MKKEYIYDLLVHFGIIIKPRNEVGIFSKKFTTKVKAVIFINQRQIMSNKHYYNFIAYKRIN